METGGATFLIAPVELPPRLLVLGAGPDAMPLVEIAGLMNWHVTVLDHRPAYAVAERFPRAQRVALNPAGELTRELQSAHYDAAVVMSHHLLSDQAYLDALAAHESIPYIGLLGPAPRRARLMQELGEKSPRARRPAARTDRSRHRREDAGDDRAGDRRARFRRCSPAAPAARSAVRCRSASADNPCQSHPHRQLRTRLPVSANTALAIAGAIGGTPGSPRPPSAAPERMNSTLMLGASASFGIGRSWKLLCTTRPSSIVTSLNSAADSPKMMPPSTCADGRVRIDDVAAIDSGAHPMHFDASVDDLHFGDFGHDRAEALDQRDPAAATGRRRRAPARHLRCLLEHGQMARRLRQQRRDDIRSGSLPAACASSSTNDSVKKPC